MKKILTVALVAVLALGVNFKAQAIENPYETGTFTLAANLGVAPGFGGNIMGDYVLVNEWWKGHFTVGGYIGFSNYKYNKSTVNDYKVWDAFNNLCFMPRATYGLNITNEFEVHAGVMTGIVYRSWSGRDSEGNKYKDSDNNEFHYDPFAFIAGCRYFFTDHLAANAEFNYSGYMPYLNVGLAYRF